MVIANRSRGVSEILPLKQGLKPDAAGNHEEKCITVSEILPLKQGLKLFKNRQFIPYLKGLRDTSIKTRIETRD